MNCVTCGKETFIAHHVSYKPEISVPICVKCHRRIHYQDWYLIDPLQCDNWGRPEDIPDLASTMPEHLRHYVEIAYYDKTGRRKDFMGMSFKDFMGMSFKEFLEVIK